MATYTVNVTLNPRNGRVSVSSLPTGTVVKHNDTVKWLVSGADQWKLSIAFEDGATLNPGIRDVLISGNSNVEVSRTLVSPRGTIADPRYEDDYTVTFKNTPFTATTSPITGSSSLMIERNIDPGQPIIPRRRRSFGYGDPCRAEGAAAPDPY